MDLKRFPDDVIRLIYSFGFPEYISNMSAICSELLMSSRIMTCNIDMLFDEYQINSEDRGMYWLLARVDDEILQDLFKQCTKCCCCSRHCHNRPTNYYTDDLSVGENFTQDEECRCRCRTTSRCILVAKQVMPQPLATARFNRTFVPMHMRMNS